MNPTSLIDSKLWLDVIETCSHPAVMTLYLFQLYWQRVDETKNMARYYALSIQPTLFGEAAVVRCWGRIGRARGEKTEVFDTEHNAMVHFLDLARKNGPTATNPLVIVEIRFTAQFLQQRVDDSGTSEWQGLRINHDAEMKSDHDQ